MNKFHTPIGRLQPTIRLRRAIFGSAPAVIVAGWLAFFCRVEGAGPPEWLDVRDCGASGSIFKTSATAMAGSNQVTVTEVGDFKVEIGRAHV